MAQITILDGTPYSIPDPGDTGWGANLTAFLVALAPVINAKLSSFPILAPTGSTPIPYSFSSFPTSGMFMNSAFGLTDLTLKHDSGTLKIDGSTGNGLQLTSSFGCSIEFIYSSMFIKAPTVFLGTPGFTTVLEIETNEVIFQKKLSPVLNNTIDIGNSIQAFKDGFFSGDISLQNTGNIINLVDPVNPQDAATKAYVDASVAANTVTAYRRPNLSFISITTVDVENNTGIANQTTIVFPDGSTRSVTENTGVTSQYRRFIITETAEFTAGTENSGLRSGLAETNNTWYAIYAVKSQINAANFVLVGDTTLPLQANFGTLNTRYGTNGWLYIGMIRNGDNLLAQGDIISFVQAGPNTHFTNSVVLSSGVTTLAVAGFQLASATGTATYTYSAGTGSIDIPNQITYMTISATNNIGGGVNPFYLANAANTVNFTALPSFDTDKVCLQVVNIPAVGGVRAIKSSNAISVALSGFIDSILSAGINPIL